MADTIILALALAKDMDVPQSAASQLSHEALLAHGYKLPVGLAGDGSAGTHSYRRFACFEMPYGSDWHGIPIDDWFADFGEVYTARELYSDNGGPLAELPAGTSVYYGNNLVTSDMWAYHSAVAFHRGALVYAVDHGATGAAAAYARITGASNYTTTGFATFSVWGFTPR